MSLRCIRVNQCLIRLREVAFRRRDPGAFVEFIGADAQEGESLP